MLISVRDLHRVYQVGSEQVHALNGVDFDVAPNEYLAVMGPSGSGKSTLMNIIGCLDTPTGGSYRLKDREIGKLSDDVEREIAGRAHDPSGRIFRDPAVWPRLQRARQRFLHHVFSQVQMLDPENAGQRRHHFSRLMTEKMLDQLRHAC